MFAEPLDDDRQAILQAAACSDGSGALVDLFFSEELGDIADAKAICARCPVRDACLRAAEARREPYGVWGGQLFSAGKVIPFKRPRGRPSKAALRVYASDDGSQSAVTNNQNARPA